ncbi:hypothetical protein BC938DRAFT_475039 [Jimgerdemannia flammicorona]|uniref:Uncharacterized protein n=1 Tax=Jimgerdemannia flammicorona TaxID=994334 RepID=A0A433Q122_9FUNG|nr:hypothetical protein BC938DRAFT_475039 [Jimgerdemannia flammicorona]
MREEQIRTKRKKGLEFFEYLRRHWPPCTCKTSSQCGQVYHWVDQVVYLTLRFHLRRLPFILDTNNNSLRPDKEMESVALFWFEPASLQVLCNGLGH